MSLQPEPGARDGPMDSEGCAIRPGREDLARELGGDLPCAGCGYNLRGLSVRSVCPECATPIRATILATVDPYAVVLRPILWPRATAAGIMLWSCSALGAALAAWALRVADGIDVLGGRPVPHGGLAFGAAGLIVLCAVGALALVRPHDGISLARRAGALGGVAATLALAWVFWRIHGRFDMSHVHPYFVADQPAAERTQLRLLSEGLAALAILLLRPNARLLASRSLLLRMGRVDRQTMLAMVLSLAVAGVGDAVHLASAWVPARAAILAASMGNFLIAVGSMLFTVGLAGVVLDCARIAPVLLRPPLSIGRVLHAEGAA